VIDSIKIKKTVCRIVALIPLVSFPLLAQMQSQSPGDEVAARQSVAAFNSITDGQPGEAGQLQISFTGAWLDTYDESFQMSFEYTPGGNSFFKNMILGLTVPTLDVGEGIIDFEKSISVVWLQRWFYGRKATSTFSTQISIQFPYEEEGSSKEIDVTVLGILAQDAESGTLYVNAYLETINSKQTRDLEWGVIVGYKQPIKENLALFGDLYYLGGLETRRTGACVRPSSEPYCTSLAEPKAPELMDDLEDLR